MKFESKIEEVFFDQMSMLLGNNQFKIEKGFHYHDFLLFYRNNPLAVIEMKANEKMFSKGFEQLKVAAENTKVELLIVSDGNRSELRRGKSKDSENFESLHSLAQYLRKLTRFDSEDLAHEVALVIKHVLVSSKYYSRHYAGELTVDRIADSLILVEGGVSFDPSTGLEDYIFSGFLEDPEGSEIYRYSSWGSIFKSIESESVRMNGLAGMNDNSELHYADSYLELKESFESLSEEDMRELNERFILSCSSLKDDLTMWRLYSEDGAGAAVTMEIKKDMEKSFFIKRVSYALPSGRHPALDVLKVIIRKLKKLKLKLFFKRYHIWKHFFKPYEYVIEKEIRILFVNSLNRIPVQWGLTMSHTIANPYIIVPLNLFPARFAEVTFGVRFPEKIANLKQLKCVSEGRGSFSSPATELKIQNSKIVNYRG
jgi:hypothetical protein